MWGGSGGGHWFHPGQDFKYLQLSYKESVSLGVVNHNVDMAYRLNAWILVVLMWVAPVVPSGMSTSFPRRYKRVAFVADAQVELDNKFIVTLLDLVFTQWRGKDAREGNSNRNKGKREAHDWMNKSGPNENSRGGIQQTLRTLRKILQIYASFYT